MSRQDDFALLNDNGWIIECESPFEIRHSDGSFASGQGARAVLDELKYDFEAFSEEEMGEAFRAGRERGVYIASVIVGRPINGEYPLFDEFIKKLKQKRLEE